MSIQHKHLSLKERASHYQDLIQTDGWALLQQSFRPEIRTRISDTDAKEAFIYEAIRAQVIQEIFSTPQLVIRQAEQRWQDWKDTNHIRTTPSPEPDSLSDYID